MLASVTLDAVFDTDECSKIVRLAEDQWFADGGLVRGEQDGAIRRSRITWLDESSADWVFNRVVETVIDANRTHFGFDLVEFAERMQIARYDAQHRGHFDWHIDIGDGAFAKRRKLSFVIQLTTPEAYEGGDLELNATGWPKTASQNLGSAVLFPSFIPHRVTPVTRGHRYSLTKWIHGPPFR